MQKLNSIVRILLNKKNNSLKGKSFVSYVNKEYSIQLLRDKKNKLRKELENEKK
jgi:hypothetical protein